MAEIGLVAVLASPSQCEPLCLRTLSHKISWLEIHASWSEEIDVRRLRKNFHGKLVCSFRREPGDTSVKSAGHLARLQAAVATFDLIELEADHEDFLAMLDFVPAEKRMISWSGTARTVNSLRRRFGQIARYPAKFYKLVTNTTQASDALIPLALLKSLGRSDLIAYGSGAAGFWSRLVAPQLGSSLVYAPLEKSTSEIGVTELITDYGFPDVSSVHRLYGIVGNPVLQSLSPQLHNTAYRRLGFPGLFIPFHVDCFQDFWKKLVQGCGLELLGIPLCGLTVVSPFKETALKLVTACSPMVRHAGSANIFVRNGDSWRADTTDPESIMHTTLERGLPIFPKKVAVIGCGGAGRAVAAALHQAGADVTLVNRSQERANFAAELLGLPFVSLSQFSTAGFSVLVNATPVGRDATRLPIEISSMDSGAIVVDLAYGKNPTPLVTEAAAHGYTVIDGYDVLMAQVRRQFEIMIGREMPEIPMTGLLRAQTAALPFMEMNAAC